MNHSYNGTSDVLSSSSPKGYRENCFSYSRQHDGRVLRASIDGLFYLPQSNGAEKQTPINSVNGGREKIPIHSLHKHTYDHPYTKEKRPTDVALVSLPLLFTSIGKTKLYDFTVKDANHYITYNGFVNKNCFDEITHFLESQFRFLCGWLRSSTPGQNKRVVCTGNPPTNADGQWVLKFWAPWLDPNHPNPAKPGELRWFTTINGKDQECEDGKPFYLDGKLIQPLSRTFIPSKVQDNIFMMRSGYEAILQAMPEPLRSQMLNGDFWAGVGDDPWQIIPSAWVEEAMSRWTEDGRKGTMDSIGVDVARGGKDKTILAPRYGTWFDKLKTFPGAETPDGAIVTGLIVSERRDGAVVHVDVIGPGSSVVDHCRSNEIQVVPINGSATARDEESLEDATDKASHTLRFKNYRAMLFWRMREALDPKTGDNIALPPDSELKADLCSVQWKITPGGIQAESKEDIIKRIGRSPDKGDAAVYGLIATPKVYMSAVGFIPKRAGKVYGRR